MNNNSLESRPNIIFIVADSLRKDFVKYYNKNENSSPFIDSLIKKSVVFKNPISIATTTVSALPSLFTSLFPFENGPTQGISKKSETIAEVLKKNGYNTYAFIGDNPRTYPVFNFNKGFDHYYFESGLKRKNFLASQRKKKMIPKAAYPFLVKIYKKYRILKNSISVLIKPPKLSITGEQLNDEAKRVLTTHEKNKPFFLWIQYMDTHEPYFSGIDSLGKNRGLIGSIQAKLSFIKNQRRLTEANEMFDYTGLNLESMKLKKALKINKEAYRGTITYVDEKVKALFEFIENKFENNIYIFTADHGTGFLEHIEKNGKFNSVHHEYIEVPLFIHNSSKKEFREVNNIVSTINIPKTISEICRAENNFRGENLLKTDCFSKLNGCAQLIYEKGGKKDIISADDLTQLNISRIFSYQNLEFKYSITEENEIKIFDLKKDPQEMNNLSVNENENILEFKKEAEQCINQIKGKIDVNDIISDIDI